MVRESIPDLTKLEAILVIIAFTFRHFKVGIGRSPTVII